MMADDSKSQMIVRRRSRTLTELRKAFKPRFAVIGNGFEHPSLGGLPRVAPEQVLDVLEARPTSDDKLLVALDGSSFADHQGLEYWCRRILKLAAHVPVAFGTQDDQILGWACRRFVGGSELLQDGATRPQRKDILTREAVFRPADAALSHQFSPGHKP
jgi:hypothetical protein